MKFAIISDPKLKAEIKQNRESKVMLTSAAVFSGNMKAAQEKHMHNCSASEEDNLSHVT